MSCPFSHPVACPGKRKTPRCAEMATSCLTHTQLGVAYEVARPTPPLHFVGNTLEDLITQYTITAIEPLSLHRSHRSLSVMAYAKRGDQRIALKGYLGKNDGLSYEATMYARLAAVAQGVPNLVVGLATVTFLYQAIEDEAWAEFFDRIVLKNPMLYFAKPITLIITEFRERTESLAHYLRTHREAGDLETRLKSITFQILVTLHALTLMGMQHNDLHTDNVLIDTASTTPDIRYYVNDQYVYNVPIQDGMILLFDWDRGYFSGKLNPTLDKQFCAQQGMCNSINARVDMLKILTSMALLLKNSMVPLWFGLFERLTGVKSWAEFQTKEYESSEKMEGSFIITTPHHYLCKKVSYDENCHPLNPEEPLGIPTPFFALDDEYFASFKHLQEEVS